MRGSSSSCRQRIRRARLIRSISHFRPSGAWWVWRHARRWKWLRSLRIPLRANARDPRQPHFLNRALQPFHSLIPESQVGQWSLAFCLPFLLLMAGEAPGLFTASDEKPDWIPSVVSPDLPPRNARPQEVFAPGTPPPVAVAPRIEPVPLPEPSISSPPEPPPALSEPQPVLANLATDPFPTLAREHLDRSLASHKSLCLRRDLFVSLVRAETARRAGEQEAKARQTLQSHKVVAQALRVGKLRLDGSSEATLRLEIYDSFENLAEGVPDNGPDASLFSVNLSGQRFEAFDRYASFVSAGGPIEVTNYGYAADFTADHNSNRLATGLGGTRPLIPGISAALSRALSAKLKALPGAVIEFEDGLGRSYLVTYDDQSPQGNLNIDVYRPTFGSNGFRSHVKAARVVRQGVAGISHGQEGLPFSLQNYRAALLEIAGESRLPDLQAAAPSPSTKNGTVGHEGGFADDFEAVEEALPLTRRLDQFANTPFSETGFKTTQEVTRYLEAGTQSLVDGVEFVRGHGFRPSEFPPIQRMRANLLAAQESKQAIAAEEARLRREYQECEAEIFRMRILATVEENPLSLTEVRSRIEDLECSQTAILAHLKDDEGALRPGPSNRASSEPPVQFTANQEHWNVAPDS